MSMVILLELYRVALYCTRRSGLWSEHVFLVMLH